MTGDDVEMARAEAALLARWPESRIAPDLARERALVNLLGSPETSAPVIHLAGTNGKTSTARIIESIIRAHELSTGLYLSPHLHSVRERICLNGHPIAPDVFLRIFDEVAPFAAIVDETTGQLTMFELLTGLGFATFADAPVDVMVVECGMGGRWDATNVVVPSVAVITPIAMDHVLYLGDTLAEIAAEKAGIITAPVPVVMAEQALAADAVIRAVAAEQGAPLVSYGTDFQVIGREVRDEGQVLDITGLGATYEDLFLPLHGEHQAQNAALAIAAVESFLGERALPIEAVREGLAGATSPGRLEVLRTGPLVLADAAHNPHGVASLSAALSEAADIDHVIVVLAVLTDKDVAEMISLLGDMSERVIVTRNSSPRSFDPTALGEIARSVLDPDRVDVRDSIADALELAIEEVDLEMAAGVRAAVVITGSVATVADARHLLGRDDEQ